MISFDVKDLKVPQLHGFLLAAVAPRPICFASTMDAAGNVNLSPFSFFNVFGSNPPIAIFSPARSGRTGLTKHTLDNVKEVGEVVINVVSYDMVQQMSLASTEYPKGVNEFVKAGFTMLPSETVKPPRVKESPFHMECVVQQVIETGTQGGAGQLVIAEIKKIHISEAVMTEGKIDQNKIKVVGRLGENWYSKGFGDALFEVQKPLTTMGIGVDKLPEKIRLSKILTGNNLGMLGNVEQIPGDGELGAYLERGAINELFEDYKHNKARLEEELHIFARNLLNENKVHEAWLVLLASLR